MKSVSRVFSFTSSKSAQEWFNEGAMFYGADNDKALEAFNKAIDLNKQYADAYALKADILRIRGEKVQALELLDLAISIDNRCTLAYYNKAKLLSKSNKHEAEKCLEIGIKTQTNNSFTVLFSKGSALFLLGKPQEAIDCQDKVIQLKPGYASAYCYKGISLYHLGKHQEAIQCYDKAIQLSPGYSLAYLNKGFSLYKFGKHKEAIDCYDKAINLTLEAEIYYVYVYLNKGFSLYALGRHMEAIQCYDKTMQIDPNDVHAWAWCTYFNKGISLYALGRHMEAIQCHDKAIQFKSDYADAYFNKGISLYALGKHMEAIQCHDKAIQFKPDYADAYLNKGISLYALGRHMEAIQCYDKAIQFKPDYADAYLNKGFSLYHLGKYKESIDCYNKTIQLKPDSAAAYSNVGHSLCALGKTQDAIKWYDKAIQVKPDFVDAYNGKACVLHNLGKYQEAVKWYTNAIQIDHDYLRGYINRSLALKALGENKEALSDFKTASQLAEQGKFGYGDPSMIKRMKDILDELSVLEEGVNEVEKYIYKLDKNDSRVQEIVGKFKILQQDKGVFEKQILSQDFGKEVDEKVQYETEKLGQILKKNLEDLKKEILEIQQKQQVQIDNLDERVSSLEEQTKQLVELGAKGQASVEMIKKTLFSHIKLSKEHEDDVNDQLKIIASEVAKGKANGQMVQMILKEVNDIVKEHGQRLDQHDVQIMDLQSQTQVLVELQSKGQASVEMIKKTLFSHIKLSKEHEDDVNDQLKIIASEVVKGKAKGQMVQMMLKNINETVQQYKTYCITDIIYDNKILNHPDLANYIAKHVGMNKVLDLGWLLDQDLVHDGVMSNNYEVVLAGIMSLDNSNFSLN